MGTGQNFVTFVVDTLDFEKDITMRVDALVCQMILWDLPGRYTALLNCDF